MLQKIDVRMGFAFIEFEDRRDAEEAIAGEALSYSCNWRVDRCHSFTVAITRVNIASKIRKANRNVWNLSNSMEDDAPSM